MHQQSSEVFRANWVCISLENQKWWVLLDSTIYQLSPLVILQKAYHWIDLESILVVLLYVGLVPLVQRHREVDASQERLPHVAAAEKTDNINSNTQWIDTEKVAQCVLEFLLTFLKINFLKFFGMFLQFS